MLPFQCNVSLSVKSSSHLTIETLNSQGTNNSPLLFVRGTSYKTRDYVQNEGVSSTCNSLPTPAKDVNAPGTNLPYLYSIISFVKNVDRQS